MEGSDEDIFLHYYPLAKMQHKWACGPVVVGQRPCVSLIIPPYLTWEEEVTLKGTTTLTLTD
jgi:hypothetical protein